MQYRLRTLLIVLALLPPIIAVQYRSWRDRELWRSLELAKREQDRVLRAWRTTYGATGQTSAAQEAALREQYFAAREDAAKARAAIQARYGSLEKALQKAPKAARK